MCGICGWIAFNGEIEENVLIKMRDSLIHRGPDDCGSIILTSKNRWKIGLAHRRLSIIDISSFGRQPMTNEDNSIHLVYNGEIYNFLELREELIKKGHKFRSRTDSEVIIHSYEEWGEECFKKFNGMFAIGLWDTKNETLFLVRDRMGKKPVYYFESPHGFLFASELKALLLHPYLKKEIDKNGLVKYLLFDYLLPPTAIIKGVKKLKSSHILKLDSSGRIKTYPFWNIPVPEKIELSDEEIEKEIVELLLKATERRLISDVPLGVFLSGGIDSSSVVAMMAEILPPKEIKTFSIGFEEKSFDESDYFNLIAKKFGTDHYSEKFTIKNAMETIPEVLEFLDEPFADPSILPTYMLSKITRKRVTVALGGDGGDELFAGYPTFQAMKLSMIYEKIPYFIRKNFIERIVKSLPVSTKDMSFDFKAKQFIKGIPYPHHIRNQIWLSGFSPEEIKECLEDEVLKEVDIENPFSELEEMGNGLSVMDRMIYIYKRTYLAEDILMKVDRASMAVSLEVRAPFLDKDFVEFVSKLPFGKKMKGLKMKFILKRALRKYLPEEIIYRKKKGFGIPVAEWLKKDLKDDLIKTLSKTPFIKKESIKKIMDEHISGRIDHRKKLWPLYIFGKWAERWL